MDDRALVAAIVTYIEENLTESITVEELAEKAGYSPNRLRQKFFNVTGETPSGYARKRRLTEAAKELLNGMRPVDVALTYGYSSQDNFTTAFRSHFGVTPSELGTIDDKYRRFFRKLREAYSIMEIANLKQPPLNTTMMGCIKGATDYFDNDLSVPMLYGLTGHAFLINIHSELCPSSPYVWNHDRFFKLLKRLGIAQVGEFHRSRETSQKEVAETEKRIRAALDEGKLIVLDFMEHQLVSGYDEKGLTMLLPWGGDDSEVKAITFGSWEECMLGEGWAHLTVIEKTPRAESLLPAAKEAFTYALDLYRNPHAYAVPGYSIGYEAYEAWIEAVKKGLGESHGHWWCAQVWSECRRFGSEFFTELAELADDASIKKQCRELKPIYATISESIAQASDRSLDKEKQTELLGTAMKAEHAAEPKLEALVAAL
jgi:AraC-like DNA-binding protein